LLHYFYPVHTNDHKPRLLHTPVLLFLSFLLLSYQLVLQLAPQLGVDILGYAANIPPAEVVRLTNIKRQEVGAGQLEVSPTLEAAARKKGEHMLANNYWAHVAPDGTEPWYFFIDSGYNYKYAGENLARDFSNPESAVEAWMASPSHRDNLLSGKYSQIGIAVVEGDLNGVDTTIIVQLFGAPVVDLAAGVPIAQARTDTTSPPEPALESEGQQQPAMQPTATPLPEITPVAEAVQVAEQLPAGNVGSGSGILSNLTISPFESTKSLSVFTITILLGVFTVDGIVVAKKKLPRVGGRTFAHIAFLGMIFAVILIAKAGQIL
ncbi:hypothetical protein JXA63_05120, partial [Candidatus Woesebacteria bacterium]|nr:hypothetical protein [Candidatus Woesebacteria bacterium]